MVLGGFTSPIDFPTPTQSHVKVQFQEPLQQITAKRDYDTIVSTQLQLIKYSYFVENGRISL